MKRRVRLSVLILFPALTAAAAAQSANLSMNGGVADPSNGLGAVKALLAADLDGDGLTDLIGSVAPRASIWRQIEGGRFTPLFPSNPKVGGRVLVADLDGDGALSLVSVNPTTITAREFTAPFVLGPQEDLAANTLLNTSILTAAADLDGDGHDDVLAAGLNLNEGLLAWLGDGAGGLKPALVAFASSSSRSDLGDLDLDGTLDTLAVNLAGATPLIGQGDGTFQALPTLPGTVAARCAALGHANGDGLLDAAIGVGTETQLHFGTGGGAFTPGATIPALAQALHFGDSDRDGDDDLLVVQQGFVSVHILDGGAPGASAGFYVANLPFNSDATFVDIGGVPGVAAVNSLVDSSDITISLCGPDGLPTLDQVFPVVKGEPTALADVDGDGRKDLVVVQKAAKQIVVHQVPGDGTIGSAGPGTPFDFPILSSVTVVNLDGDAREDLVLLSDGAGTQWTPWRSNGDGSFTPGTAALPGPFSHGTAFGDLDADGDEDILFLGPSSAWHASGPGGFGPAQAVVIPDLPTQNGLNREVLADADGDGLAELFIPTSTPDSGELREWKGLGNGSFAPPQLLTSGPHILGDIIASDLNGDGHVDIAATGSSTALPLNHAEVTVLYGNGDGSFGPAQSHPAGSLLQGAPAPVDFDGDGHSDLLVLDLDPARLRLLRQAADGSFGGPLSIAFGGPLAADVNGDGIKDLLGGSAVDSLTGEQPLRVGHMNLEPGALNLGFETSGAVGKPMLTGGGDLRPAQLAFLDLQAAPANTPVLLMLGLDTIYAPFGSGSSPFGAGTLVPDPQLVLGGLSSTADGSLHLKARWPADAPPGLTVYVQVWCTDPIWGWPVASNALQFEGE